MTFHIFLGHETIEAVSVDELQAAVKDRDEAAAEAERLRQKLDQYAEKIARTSCHRDELIENNARLRAQYESAAQVRDSLTKANQKLVDEKACIEAMRRDERNYLERCNAEACEAIEQQSAQLANVQAELESVRDGYRAMGASREAMRAERDQARADLKVSREACRAALDERDELRKRGSLYIGGGDERMPSLNANWNPVTAQTEIQLRVPKQYVLNVVPR